MDLSFSTLSHALGSSCYILLALFIARRFLRRMTDRALFVASIMSSVWLGIMAIQSINGDVPFAIRYTLELARNAAWFGVMFTLLGVGFLPKRELGATRFNLIIVSSLLLFFMIIVTLVEGIFDIEILSGTQMLYGQIAISFCGLILLEQVWRNASSYSRTGLKYLSVAMAAILAYDFIIYTNAILFSKLPQGLWDARGAANALVTPLVALTMVNSQKQPIRMQVSRQMMFHSGTLTIAGIYLLIISSVGYYINLFGGTWGQALRALFLFTGATILVLLMSSPLLRARIMVFISKNFFDYKYDYRDEWIKSTNALSRQNDKEELAHQTLTVLCRLVDSHVGVIWCRSDDGDMRYSGQIGMPGNRFGDISHDEDLPDFFQNTEWIVNIDEYLEDPNKYNLIEIPEPILKAPNPWLIIPVRSSDYLSALVLICGQDHKSDLNWENYDMLKIVAQQAGSYLGQNEYQEQLLQSRQFDAVNKTSAFMVHDLKTMIAQLSLLVSNAEKHKSNPDFVDDMIATTHHTVEKMDHLLQQIRNPNQETATEEVALSTLLEEIKEHHRKSEPNPSFDTLQQEILIKADREQLRVAISHIIQNAQDATPKDGEVSVAIKKTNSFVFIFIQDNGGGMTESFISNNLFKPFESTKGLTGMGIGVFQCREYLKKMGGSIDVTSEINVGTCFTLKIPMYVS